MIQTFHTSSNGDQRLSKGTPLTFGAMRQILEKEAAVFVDPLQRFQKLLGIGGAITDAAAEAVAMLPDEKQKDILEVFPNVHVYLAASERES